MQAINKTVETVLVTRGKAPRIHIRMDIKIVPSKAGIVVTLSNYLRKARILMKTSIQAKALEVQQDIQ